MNFCYVFYCFLFYFCVNVYAADDKISEKNESSFVPTREWQVVKKGK